MLVCILNDAHECCRHVVAFKLLTFFSTHTSSFLVCERLCLRFASFSWRCAPLLMQRPIFLALSLHEDEILDGAVTFENAI